MSAPHRTTTHERFIDHVRTAIVSRALSAGTLTAEQAEHLLHAKLLYGVGDGSYRGQCYYDAWENGIGRVCVVEIAALAQESWIQLAGTTLHELAHVLAGFTAGHGTEWKDAAVQLGFKIRPAAAGQRYYLAMLAPILRHAIHALAAEIGDGHPAFRTFGGAPLVVKPPPVLDGRRNPRRHVTRQGLRLAAAALGMRVRQAGQSPGVERRLPSTLRRVQRTV